MDAIDSTSNRIAVRSFATSTRLPALALGICTWMTTGLALAGLQDEPGTSQEPRPLVSPPQDLPGGTTILDPRRSHPELTTVPSDVRDSARLFSVKAVRAARDSLEKLEKSIGAPVLIESIDSLEGEDIDRVAARLARRSGNQGIYVLIAREDSKLEVLPSRRYLDSLPRDARTAVRAEFIKGFRDQDFDKGLQLGIQALERALSTARKAGKLPPAERPEFEGDENRKALLPTASGEPSRPGSGAVESRTASQGPGVVKRLVRRNRIHLTLDGARTIITGAIKQAEAMNLKINIAVVDDGGHLLSFDRMDDARPASGYTAITKATTAATFRQPTGSLPPGAANPDPLLNLSLQLAALSSGGKLTTLFGGVPVVVDEQIIGGVGVGGGTGEQDAAVARAGIQLLLDALKQSEASSPLKKS